VFQGEIINDSDVIGLIQDSRQVDFQIAMQIIDLLCWGKQWKKGKLRKILKYHCLKYILEFTIKYLYIFYCL